MDIKEKLVLYFKEHTGIDVSADTHLIEESVIDSMGIMELIAFIEQAFSIELDMDDLTIDNFSTIIHISNLINEKGGQE